MPVSDLKLEIRPDGGRARIAVLEAQVETLSAELLGKARVVGELRAELQQEKATVAAVEMALRHARVPRFRDGQLTRLSLMGRVGWLGDHRNRLLDRCRAAGLPTD